MNENNMNFKNTILCSGLLLAPFSVSAETTSECLQRLVVGADRESTIAELQAQCNEQLVASDDQVDTYAEERKVAEQAVVTNRFTLLQHYPNYALPVAYNFNSDRIPVATVPGNPEELDATEFKFQISFKSLLWNQPFGTKAQLYAAYTNTSWWQAYNKDESSPFRETNHQPELFVDIPSSLRAFGWELTNARFGVSHVSNGRSGDFSRTWNRIYAEFVASNEFNEIRFKPWSTISDIEDNPDIDEFAGKFQLEGRHLIGKHSIGWKTRHTLDSNNRGSLELDWSSPIAGREDLKLFLQYFNGYGESLIDYNIKTERLGIGFRLGK